MKKKQQHYFCKLALLIGLLLPGIAGAQTQEKTYKKFNLSIGYGLVSYFYSPNQEVTFYYGSGDSVNWTSSSQTDVVVTDIKIKPLYLRFDYKWDPKNSIGFMAIYNGYKASGVRTDSIWDANTSTYNVSSSDLFYSMHRLRFQVVYTRHFFVDRPRVNTYFYTSLGVNLKFNKSKEESETGLPNYSSFDISRIFPISSRLCYGLRYNFSESMSLHTEVGLGGPLLSIGLTAKF